MDELEPENMLWELLGNSLEVVLIPAPEQRHSNHCIRVAQYVNPVWYQKFCALYPPGYRTRCSTIIKRSQVIRALEQIIEGKTTGIYVERLREFIRIENSKKKESPRFQTKNGCLFNSPSAREGRTKPETAYRSKESDLINIVVCNFSAAITSKPNF